MVPCSKHVTCKDSKQMQDSSGSYTAQNKRVRSRCHRRIARTGKDANEKVANMDKTNWSETATTWESKLELHEPSNQRYWGLKPRSHPFLTLSDAGDREDQAPRGTKRLILSDYERKSQKFGPILQQERSTALRIPEVKGTYLSLKIYTLYHCI